MSLRDTERWLLCTRIHVDCALAGYLVRPAVQRDHTLLGGICSLPTACMHHARNVTRQLQADPFCRPDNSTWRTFEQLSGGQQALAALALSLAVHSTFAMAWFLCDEVDAALDVLRAAHLADYMAQSATQFVVVSHKPQVRSKPVLWTAFGARACHAHCRKRFMVVANYLLTYGVPGCAAH